MNTIKSVLVILFLLVMLSLSVCLIRHCVYTHRQAKLKILKCVTAITCCILTIMAVFFLGNYVYPFERPLEPELIATMEVQHEVLPCGSNGCKPWYAVYGQYEILPDSRFGEYEYYRDKCATQWPEYDLEHYTYIVAFCQQIDTLSYNVWDTVDYPLRTGAKDGHIVFQDEIHPTKIFIYRIPKMRIDNDAI